MTATRANELELDVDVDAFVSRASRGEVSTTTVRRRNRNARGDASAPIRASSHASNTTHDRSPIPVIASTSVQDSSSSSLSSFSSFANVRIFIDVMNTDVVVVAPSRTKSSTPPPPRLSSRLFSNTTRVSFVAKT